MTRLWNDCHFLVRLVCFQKNGGLPGNCSPLSPELLAAGAGNAYFEKNSEHR